MRWKHFAPKSALVHPIGGVSDGSEERWCLDFSKTLVLPSYAYLFLFFSCRKPAKASGAEYFEKVILVYVSASIENPAIGLQAHLCLSTADKFKVRLQKGLNYTASATAL